FRDILPAVRAEPAAAVGNGGGGSHRRGLRMGGRRGCCREIRGFVKLTARSRDCWYKRQRNIRTAHARTARSRNRRARPAAEAARPANRKGECRTEGVTLPLADRLDRSGRRQAR